MTNTHDIVIPRSELPKARYKQTLGQAFIIADDAHYVFSEQNAKALRKSALEQLAASEAINQLLAEQAKAEDEAKLREESNFLRDKLKHLYGSPDTWEQIAKAARELHGK